MIRQLMEEKNENGNRVPELSVEFDADTEVIKDQYTYNIVGKIPGTDSDSMILLSAHYDSYFEGFQDDNAAVAMIIGIARRCSVVAINLAILLWYVLLQQKNGGFPTQNMTGPQVLTARYLRRDRSGRGT